MERRVVARPSNRIRSSYRYGAVLGVVLLLSFLVRDAGTALATSDGNAGTTIQPHGIITHPDTAPTPEEGTPQRLCQANDQASLLAGQHRLELPAVLADAGHLPLSPPHTQTIEPRSAPPLPAAVRRAMLQVFLN
jgi:hypothetical protein